MCLCVCAFVADRAADLPYVGPSSHFSFNLQRLRQNSAGETEQKQGNTTQCVPHVPLSTYFHFDTLEVLKTSKEILLKIPPGINKSPPEK